MGLILEPFTFVQSLHTVYVSLPLIFVRVIFWCYGHMQVVQAM